MNAFLMIGGPQILIIILFISPFLLLFLMSLVDILKNKFTNSNKMIWLIAVILIPVLGSVLYFFVGRKQKIKN